MKKNGNHRTRNYDAEIAFHQKARTVPPAARLRLLDRLRRAHARRPGPGRHAVVQSQPEVGRTRRLPRTFWILDPATGEWHLL